MAEAAAGTEQRSMRPFFVVWGGQAVSLLGSQLVQFAIVWWLTQTTGSATMLAMATLAALLPQILVGPFAGALVDRWRRKTVMIAADATVAAATLLLAGLFALQAAAVWAIFLLLFVRAAAGAFHWPAMTASTTLMVPRAHLSRIGGLNQALSGIAGIAIPPLGALVIQVLPMQSVLLIDVATALPAILALCFIPIPQPAWPAAGEPNGRRTLLADVREGLRFIFGWKALLYLVLVGLVVGILGPAAASLMPLMITQHFGGGALQYGGWQSAYGAGLVSGGILLGLWGGSRRRILTSMLSLAVDGLVCIGIALTPRAWFPATYPALYALGFVESLIFGINGAIGQAVVPPEMQGRVFAIAIWASQVAAPLGLLIAGPFADAYGVTTWWLISAALIMLTGLGAMLTPALMHIEESRAPEKTAAAA